MVEKTIENKFKLFLKNQNVFYFKTFGNLHQINGLPDIIICRNSLFIGIEIKRWPNKLSAIQKVQLKRLKNNGALIIILDQDNLNELIENWHDEKTIIRISENSIKKYFKS